MVNFIDDTQYSGLSKHTIIKYSPTQYYVWGEGTNYKKGDGNVDFVLKSTLVDFGLDFKYIHTGLRSSMALTEDGSLYVVGDGIGYGLGTGTTDIYKSWTKHPTSLKFKKLASGQQHNYGGGITVEGDLYIWGTVESNSLLGDGTNTGVLQTPTQIATGVKFKDICFGYYNCIALSEDGDVYTWGINSACSLGIGSTVENKVINIPTKITAPEKMKSVHVHTNAITTCLSETGKVYQCGKGISTSSSFGSLLATNTSVLTDVTPVTDGTIKQVLVTSTHPPEQTIGRTSSVAFFLTEKNTLHSYGGSATANDSASYHMLGTSPATVNTMGIVVKDVKKIHATATCGMYFDEDNNLYSWGSINSSSSDTAEVFNGHGRIGVVLTPKMLFNIPVPSIQATFGLVDSKTYGNVTESILVKVLKNNIEYKTLTYSNGLNVKDLDETSKWSIKIEPSEKYNELTESVFSPSFGNPVYNYYLTPTVTKTFNFYDEKGVLATGKNIKLVIKRNNVEFINTTITTGTYTTIALYSGNYSYVVTCDGYSSVRSELTYDSNNVKVSFIIYTPTNKTLILHDGKYKKISKRREVTTTKTPSANIIPAMASDTKPTPFVASASSHNTDTYTDSPYKAFSRVVNNASRNYWYSGGVPMPSGGHWLKIDTGELSKYIVNSYSISSFSTYKPKDWIFEASDNNVNWTILDSRSGVTFSSDTAKNKYDFSNEKAYRYYRIRITSASSSANYTMVSTFELGGFVLTTVIVEGKYEEIEIVGVNVPTSDEFLSDGMDSLSPLLDRRLTTLEPQPMTDKSEILQTGEVGKVFSKTLSLKKYIDLRSISLKK